MSETSQTKNRGPRAGDLHPVPTRIVTPADQLPQRIMQEPSIEVYDPIKRKVRDLQKKKLEAEELDVDLDLEEKKTTITELRAKREALSDRKNASDAVNRRGSGVESMEVSPELAKTISEMDEDKREAFLRTYSMMQAARGGDQAGAMLPLMLAYSQNHSAPDIQNFGQQIVEAFTSGMQMMSANSGGSDVKDQMLLKAFEKLTEQKPAEGGKTDAITLITQLKDAGLVYTPAQVTEMISKSRDSSSVAIPMPTGPSNTDLELKRIEMTMGLETKKIDTNMQLELAKLNLEKQKSDNMGNLATRLMNTAGRALAEGELEGLDEKAGTTKGLPANAPTAAIGKESCPNCGAEIIIPEPDKARTLKCVKCGQELKLHPSEVSEIR